MVHTDDALGGDDLRAANLRRLLNPTSIAFVGGRTIAGAVQRCRDFGFSGDVWLVNPTHAEIDGIRCRSSIADLPYAPDAVFIAVPAAQAIGVVRDLAERGARGAVVYASGFSEVGSQGAALQAMLLDAAGSMAILGPNCYGFLNGLNGSALWPVAHGAARVDEGVAVITQSGNLAYNLSMITRTVPFAYLVSVGNQATVSVARLIDAFLDNPKVRAIGVHIEGLTDVHAFSAAATRALVRGVPIVALKSGVSKLGAQLALSHTSSLAGSDVLYEALFKRLGIIRVKDPVGLVETLKLLSIGGIPKNGKLAALATSGGDAGLVADLAEAHGIALPPVNAQGRASLQRLLPAYANIANPLDFTTTPWGSPEAMRVCCDALLSDMPGAAAMILDYPKESTGERPSCKIAADAFADSVRRHGITGAIISVFPDLMPPEHAARMAEAGIAPLQGLAEGVAAIGAAMWYGQQRKRIVDADALSDLHVLRAGRSTGTSRLYDEWDSKRMLAEYGLTVPVGELVAPTDAPAAGQRLGFPVCAKVVSEQLPHKTEAGAVALRLYSQQAVAEAVERMIQSVACYAPDVKVERILVEKMAAAPLLELIVGVKREEDFGLALVLGSGGVLVELIGDTTTLLLPVREDNVRSALLNLKVGPLLTGYRGSSSADLNAAVRNIMAIARFAEAHADKLAELDVNPLLVLKDGAVAVDALVRLDG
ncbi:acetate--CoA ligase family protein [Caballeronia sordidicola]|uniref:Acetyl-CoA synthetase with ADP-forming alpha chain and beta chain n=1 Tax=Caballeronia sordidicola TaxID=196367 RepID=A0A226XA93_CABSO|nr:acetate--CoA ligase family protein [Caballeronia sordidicola]OXC79768.1 Acetyl-CoA synthetase with ADP-forming alpha chain and beta chain [Caballeronia sordidicola]